MAEPAVEPVVPHGAALVAAVEMATVDAENDDELRAVASLPHHPRPQESLAAVDNPGALGSLRKAVTGVAAALSFRLIVPVTDAVAFRKTVAASLEGHHPRGSTGGAAAGILPGCDISPGSRSWA